jgi:hypothetical protein
MKVNQKVEKCGKAETEMDGSCKEWFTRAENEDMEIKGK